MDDNERARLVFCELDSLLFEAYRNALVSLFAAARPVANRQYPGEDGFELYRDLNTGDCYYRLNTSQEWLKIEPPPTL